MKPTAWLAFSFFTGLLLIGPKEVNAQESGKGKEKITIGRAEEVILLPWGIKLPARVDTGAAKSSLGAPEMKVDGNRVEIRLRKEFGGMKLRFPIIEWGDYKTSQGSERRPVVEVVICLGTKRIRTKVNINDRSELKYPFLIGRDLLRGRFVVDVSRYMSLAPNCKGVRRR